MRMGHDGLFALVREQWKKDPFTGHLFVFFGRAHDRVKVLFWDRGGFVVYYKRLEKGRFRWPRPSGDDVHIEVDGTVMDDNYFCRSTTTIPAGRSPS